MGSPLTVADLITLLADLPLETRVKLRVEALALNDEFDVFVNEACRVVPALDIGRVFIQGW